MMSIVGRYVVINGVKTYYEENENMGQHTVICIHIAGRESRQYHGMMDYLNGKQHLIAIDMPAHGKSWPLKGNKAIVDSTEYGDFIWDFIQTLGIKNPVVMGCSLGGNIVYELAQRHPVYAIISLQGADYTPSISEVSRALMNHPYVSLQHSHMDYSDSLIGSNPDPGARDFILWGVSQEISITKKADLTMYTGFDVRDTMHKITCPVLVVRGEDDWIVDEASVQGTLARITNAKKLVYKPLPGIGHFPAVEQPVTLSKVVDEFLINL
jgi:pimeloyl-ACP methyl ester carboxylesterase